MNKIELNESQKYILERLNSMLFHDYWPIILKSMEKMETMKEYDEMNDTEKFMYKQGYAKAVWDITYDTSAATDGFLPDDKTIEEWAKEADIKMREEFDVVEEDGWTRMTPKKK
jgi:hypothetical protein